MKYYLKNLLPMMLLVAGGAIGTSPAQSQEPDPEPASNGSSQTSEPSRQQSSNRLIEEVVVTAQKRAENIQDVPVAILAYSSEKLDAFGIESAQDLERITPGLTVTNASGFNIAYLRGIGTDAFLPGADPSVPFYLDGVALLGAQGSTDTLGRVERVEVLKGPQGTLFGRNATGGAVNIITPEPGEQFEMDVKLEFADFGERNGLLYISSPITDSIAGSIALFSNERDNYYTNEAGPIIDVFARGGRAKLRWDIAENLSITAAGSKQRASNNGGLAFENTRVSPAFSGVLKEDPEADRRIKFDSLAGAKTESYLYSLAIDWLLPWVDLKLIGSDQEVDAPFVQADFDKSEDPIVNIRSIVQLAEQETLELQLLSNTDTPFSQYFEWVAGLYYIESSGGFNPILFEIAPNALTVFGAPAANQLSDILNTVGIAAGLQPLADGLKVLSYGVLASESYSAYAQGTLFPTPTLDITLGLRYQREKRNLLNAKATVPMEDGSEFIIREDSPPELRAKQLSPRIALQWRPLGEGTQFYASWSRAFKSPTYNTVNLFDEPERVDEEKVESYELGVKTDLFDGNLRLNAAAFYIEQEDLLTGFVALASGGVVNYANAGNAEIAGVEMDFLWTPMPNWNPGLAIFGAASYLDSEYTDYKDGRGYDEDSGLAFGDGGTFPLPARDFTGNRIVRTPESTYTFGINQSIPIGNGSVEIGIDTYYNSGFHFLPQNSDLYDRDEYQLYNARISYFYYPWGLQLTVFGENIKDEEYNEVVFVDDFGRNQVLNSPRIVGVRAKWTY